jgi:hypothetical protein
LLLQKLLMHADTRENIFILEGDGF